MSEKDINPDNGLNETQPSEMGVSPGTGMGNEQPEPGRQQATARRGWGYRINKIVMECYDRSNLTKRGYRKRVFEIWEQSGEFETTEQRLVDQARHIRVNGWQSDLEMEEIQHGAEQSLNTAQETQHQANEVQEEIPTTQSENIAPAEEMEEINHHLVGDERVIDEGALSDDEV